MIGHFRAVARIVAIAVATLVLYAARLACLPLAAVAPRAFGRAHHALMRTWARTTLAVMGVRLAVLGRPPAVDQARHLGARRAPVALRHPRHRLLDHDRRLLQAHVA